MVSANYAPEAEGGIPYDDPGIGIQWPLKVAGVSDKDRQWPPLTEQGGL
jgi:dTDP-4-dehydrorhamnose 3,5-epimerase